MKRVLGSPYVWVHFQQKEYIQNPFKTIDEAFFRDCQKSRSCRLVVVVLLETSRPPVVEELDNPVEGRLGQYCVEAVSCFDKTNVDKDKQPLNSHCSCRWFTRACSLNHLIFGIFAHCVESKSELGLFRKPKTGPWE